MNKLLLYITAAVFCCSATSCAEDDFATQINTEYASSAAEASTTNPQITESSTRIGTYNLWVTSNGTGDYAWGYRRQNLAQSIVDNDFDIFGFQECDGTIQAQLPGLVAGISDVYDWWFDSNSHIGISYKRDRFALSDDKKVFWLSDTPDVSSKCWDGYTRVCAYVEVTDKLYNRKFGMMVTHGPLLSDEYRSMMAELLNKRVKLYSNDQLPVILVGDMNTKPTEPAYTTLTQTWIDSFSAVDEEYKSGPVGTFNSHSTATVLNTDTRRIDYVFAYDPNKEIELLTYRVDITTYGGLYPSDHCPVSVQMNINHYN
jgi:endonuclease/exonuclease/phosphatase family metal-dependent hydrolase